MLQTFKRRINGDMSVDPHLNLLSFSCSLGSESGGNGRLTLASYPDFIKGASRLSSVLLNLLITPPKKLRRSKAQAIVPHSFIFFSAGVSATIIFGAHIAVPIYQTRQQLYDIFTSGFSSSILHDYALTGLRQPTSQHTVWAATRDLPTYPAWQLYPDRPAQ